jgi:alkylation response protein AidB-like acyl-CoA dehydrogenase
MLMWPDAFRGDGAMPDLLGAASRASSQIAGWAAEDDRPGAFPARAFDLLRAEGLLSAPLPRALGGASLGTAPGSLHLLLRVLAQIGRGSLPVGRIYEGHVNALVLIDAYGTAEQCQRAADDVHAGHLFGVWNTGAADDVQMARTPSGVRLTGAKVFCSGAGYVTRPLVNGPVGGHGWHMALVPTDRFDLSVDAGWWRAEGMRASRSGRVDFTGVELGDDALIGGPDDYHREPHFNGGSVRFAAVQLGGAQALFDACTDYLGGLDRTGDPHQQMRLGEMAVGLETGYLWLGGAARLLERSDTDPADLVAYAQMTRTAIERVCLDVIERADRCVGARGLQPPHAIERIGRDLRLYLRQPATDAVVTAAGAHAAARGARLALGSDLAALPPRIRAPR